MLDLQALTLARWIAGSVFCLFALYVAGCNWAAIFLTIRNRRRGIKKGYSQGPVIGPMSGYLGLTCLPIQKSLWLWLVLAADPSTWVIAWSLPWLIRQGYRSRQ